MPLLWLAMPSERVYTTTFELEDAKPPRFSWINKGAVMDAKLQVSHDYADHGFEEQEPLQFKAGPVPAFRITDPGFTFDCFDAGIQCISSKLRKVFDFNKAVVSYREIDLSQCVPSVRAQDYQAMQPLIFADPIDKARTPGWTLDVPLPDGSVRHEWLVGIEGNKEMYQLHWRDNFVPPAPLFRVHGMSLTMATEALAAKVMAAGITDMVFVDVSGEQIPGQLILRRS